MSVEKSDIVIYQSENGIASLEVRLDHETVWLTQDQMAEQFGRERSVITKHLRNVFKEGELEEISVRAKYAHTAADDKEYQTQFYNLDAIISVGYRVNSKQGIRFRQWATQVLRDHIVKGYTVNDQRLREESAKLQEMRQTMELLARTLAAQELVTDATQIRFIDQVVSYLTQNGTMDPGLLYEPPFTDIHNEGLDGVFGDAGATKIIHLLQEIELRAAA